MKKYLLLPTLLVSFAAYAEENYEYQFQGFLQEEVEKPSSPLQGSDPLQSSSPLQSAGPLQSSSPLQGAGPLQGADPLSMAMPVQGTGPLIGAPSVQFSTPVGPVMSFPIMETYLPPMKLPDWFPDSYEKIFSTIEVNATVLDAITQPAAPLAPPSVSLLRVSVSTPQPIAFINFVLPPVIYNPTCQSQSSPSNCQ